MGPTARASTPIPIVTNLEITGAGDATKIVVCGYSLKQNMKVWFGSTEVQTSWRTDECLICVLPSFATIVKDLQHASYVNPEFEVPVSIVRDDRVIYGTNHTFNFKTLLNKRDRQAQYQWPTSVE